ncbi:iron-siderophore ABC transporter substrate-binding protein [Halomonas huangheensis]|uniref:Fe/B12 periplasmic-binding domain-containing protein n=1 Tax=Halomonas huangheensis TaxID=1178482 RepID=W1NAG9_9GAMM|nr:iron-siderophore ABC transporter substrate-binding protein [Halomonas huangheensis]ALM53425.1 ABC transporter substrate-binding protein [Halomonas huangheensis]ERL51905.1 hypothetical protein BJB45_12115 [Halomonas huangheensis]
MSTTTILLRGMLALAVLGTSLTPAMARTLDTAFGAVEVNDDPQRVVTLYEGALDASLAVGVTPVGAIATRGGQQVAGYLRDQVPDIQMVGLAGETNLEAVVALAPDLILASPRLPEEQYALLSQVAPTVVPPSAGFTPDAWQSESRLFGAALGREEQIDDALADIEARAAQLKASVSNSQLENAHTDAEGTAPDTHLVRWMPQGPLVMSTQLFSTGMLSAAGFTVDDSGLVSEGRPHSDPLSLEALPQIDGDWLFLATLNEDGLEALNTARETQAFRRLSVVSRDRVVPVDGQLWTSASGPLAAQAVLDDIESAVTGNTTP